MLLDTLSALVRLHDLETRRSFSSPEELDRAKREIERCRAEIPAVVLEAYATRKARYGATAVVPIVKNTCSGCHISLPKSGVEEIAEDVHVCDHCNRLIYDPDFAMELV